MSSSKQTLFEPADVAPDDGSRLARQASKIIAKLVGKLAYGRLRIVTPSGMSFLHGGTAEGPDATIILRNWRALRRVVSSGDIGFAEGFIEGDWTSPDRVALIRLLARNTAAIKSTIKGSPLVRMVSRVKHWMRPNSKRGSRRNIEAHYDLGNAFYRLWLDEAMVYSSAIYNSATLTLEDAQQAKLARARELLELNGRRTGARDRLRLGGARQALGAALGRPRYGHHPFALATRLCPSIARRTRRRRSRRSASPGLSRSRGPVRSHRLDRDVRGGRRGLLAFLFRRRCGARSPPEAARCCRLFRSPRIATTTIAAIPISSRSTFFPAGSCHRRRRSLKAVERAGLKIAFAEPFGLSYADTLAEWRRRFHQNWAKIAPLGFDERFRRLWTFYLEYCEAGFREGAIDVGFYTLVPQEAAQ